MTVLARLLPPKSYGVMALATIVTNLANIFRDMGSSAAIIQAKELTADLTGTVHTSNVVLGLGIGAAVAVSAPSVSTLFHEPELTKILYLLALVFPIGSISLAHQALLERESRFSVVVMAEIVAALSGLALAMLAAWSGAGVYSLVIQVFAATLIGTVMIISASDRRPRWIWSRREFSSVIAFSGNLSLFNFVAYVSRNTDSIVIGRLLGAASLGIYSVAYRIMILPLQNLTFVASRALFPVMSRRGDRLPEMAELYLKSLSLIAFLSVPMMAGLFALRELVVDVVLGEKWHASAAILGWLAPVGAMQSMVSATGTICMSRGRTDVLLRLGMLGALLHATAFAVGSSWGIEGVAAGYLVATILNAVPAFHFSGRLIGVTFNMILRRTGWCIVLALLMGGCLRYASGQIADWLPDKRLQLLVLTTLGAGLYSAAALWLLRPQWESFRHLLRPLAPR
jgi:O-antigen/teichoic acid export membrane protein